jgi:hypothetical protein
MVTLERWIEEPLLKRAKGPLCRSVLDGLKHARFVLRFHSQDSKDSQHMAALTAPIIKILRARRSDRLKRTSNAGANAEREVLKLPHVRQALQYVGKKHRDPITHALLNRPEDLERLYDGDAAQQLFREYAFRCPSPLREALCWLSMQDIARHAFAPKEDDGSPIRGMADTDLSRIPGMEVSAIERDYSTYLVHRRALILARRNEERHARGESNLDMETYVLSDDDESVADTLWKAQYAKQSTSGAAKKRLSELKKFGRGKP